MVVFFFVGRRKERRKKREKEENRKQAENLKLKILKGLEQQLDTESVNSSCSLKSCAIRKFSLSKKFFALAISFAFPFSTVFDDLF